MRAKIKLSKAHWINLFALLIYLATALNSSGYYHPDEHFQIIEFAGLKAGWNSSVDLTWEYDAQIRPALQPVIALLCINLLDSLDIYSPFLKEMTLRLLTAILALLVINCFVRSFQHTIKPTYHTTFLYLSFFLWFLPAINVRFSSETWAGLCLVLALAWIYKNNEVKNRISCLGIGFLLGLSFEFRFQLGLCIIGLFFWLKLVGLWKNWQLYYLLAGCCLPVLAGALLDSWFYGGFVCTPYNYFVSNILNGVASAFGVSPWYFYLDRVMQSATSLFGLAIWLSLFALLVYEPRHILLWCLIPFLAVHFLIPHKELRFLFPVINFLPFLLIRLFQLVMDKVNLSFLKKAVIYPIAGVMFFVNLIGLVMMICKPASNGCVEMAAYIQNKTEKHPATLYICTWNNPYSIGTAKGLTARFYLNKQIELKDFVETETENWQKQPKAVKDRALIVLPKSYRLGCFLVEGWGFKEERQSIPHWIRIVNRFYRVYDESTTLVLYTKENEQYK